MHPFGLPTSSLYAYCKEVFDSSKETNKIVVVLTAQVKLFILFFDGFSRAVFLGPAKRFWCTSFIKKCRNRVVLITFPIDTVKELFDFGIIRLIHRMDVDPSLAFLLWLVCARSTGMLFVLTTVFSTSTRL